MFKKILFIVLIIFTISILISSVSAEDNTTDESTIIQSSSQANSGVDTFTSLQNEIKSTSAKSTLYLSGTYKYDKKTDSPLKEGVVINKDLTIIGKNTCTIDGSNLARCLKIKEGCTVTLKNIKIKNGFTTSSGAGLKIYSNSKVTINNCKFDNNVAKNSNGGAIESKKSCTIKIYSSTFKNNKATSSTKSVGSDKTGMGSVIKTSIGNDVKIHNSVFKSNKAFLAMILVVSYNDLGKKTSSIHVDKCTFTKNKSEHNGVIYSDEYGRCTIKNSAFKYNYSPKGAGTIVVESSPSCEIKNCEFYKNKGCNGAGVNIKIYKTNDKSNVKIVKCKFNKNTASMYGGAICSVGGKVRVDKCQFSSNTASIFGGAIYARLGELHVSSSKFSLNKAKYAGAICSACKKGSIKTSSITKNKAYYLYSAVYNIKHNTIKKCHIKSNKLLKYSKIYLEKSRKYIKVKVTNHKDEPVEKRVKLIFKGSKKITTKWYKTSTKKSIKIKIPKSVKGTCKVSIKVKKAKYFKKTLTIKN